MKIAIFAALLAFFSVIPTSFAAYAPNDVYSGAKGVRLERATLANNGTATITSQSGSWLASVSRTATGRVTTTINTGVFSAAPSCVCTNNATIADGAFCQLISDQTSTVLHTYTGANGSGSDQGLTLICVGPR